MIASSEFLDLLFFFPDRSLLKITEEEFSGPPITVSLCVIVQHLRT